MSVREIGIREIGDVAHNVFSKIFIKAAMPRRLNTLQTRRLLYAQAISKGDICQRQIDAFNRQWAYARSRFSFYQQWQKRYDLPDVIKCLRDLNEFPVLRKDDLQQNIHQISQQAAPCSFASTGGSTGEPTRFPRAVDDLEWIYSTMYLGRSWWGIRPGDRIIQIWGHSNVFGAGPSRSVMIARRRIADWAINTKRLNAYRLDEESLAKHWDTIKKSSGAIVVTYSSVARRILEFLEDRGVDGRVAKLRAIILTSEPVYPQDIARISEVFGAPAIIEYGMGETGVLAYSRPGTDALQFFWDAFHCHVIEGAELIISTLHNIRFPLINYGTGDRVERVETEVPFSCRTISGRTNDCLSLTMFDGSVVEVHSELLTHVIKTEPVIRSFLIHQKGRYIDICLRLVNEGNYDEIIGRLLRELEKEFPGLDISFIQFRALNEDLRTLAGKQRFIIREQ